MITKNVLNIIRKSPEGIKARDICRQLDLTKNNISGTLSSLKQHGLVFNFEYKWYLCKSGNSFIHCPKCGNIVAIMKDGGVK